MHPISLRSQSGVGIIEIMIALLVMTIGLLGMAAMQTNGMQMTSESLARSQAIILANDIIERARTNLGSRGDYEVESGSVPACDATYEPEDPSAEEEESLWPSIVASNDKNEWLNNLACLLPSADAVVSVVGVQMSVTIDWASRSGLEEDGTITIEATL